MCILGTATYNDLMSLLASLLAISIAFWISLDADSTSIIFPLFIAVVFTIPTPNIFNFSYTTSAIITFILDDPRSIEVYNCELKSNTPSF